MKYFLLFLTSFLLFSQLIWAENKKNQLVQIEKISTKATFKGDLQGDYTFSGSMGDLLLASSSEENSICEVSALFRKVLYQKAPSVEVWLVFKCTLKEQIRTFKLNRFYLKLGVANQNIKLPILDEKLKNIDVSFEDVSIKKGK